MIPIIIAIIILTAVLFYTSSTAYRHHEGLSLHYYSDNGFQDLLKKDSVQEADIVTITDKDLGEVPKLKELIDMAVIKEFPFNKYSSVVSTIDTLKEHHRYFATILAEKYSKNPEDFFRTYPASAWQLEKYPNAYRHEFDGTHYVYNGVQYSWHYEHITVRDVGQFIKIHTSSFNRIGSEVTRDRDVGKFIKVDTSVWDQPLDPNRHIWASITDKDLEKMPLLKEAIGRIGTDQGFIAVNDQMSPVELSTYQIWTREKIPSAVFEYDGKYFEVGWWFE